LNETYFHCIEKAKSELSNMQQLMEKNQMITVVAALSFTWN